MLFGRALFSVGCRSYGPRTDVSVPVAFGLDFKCVQLLSHILASLAWLRVLFAMGRSVWLSRPQLTRRPFDGLDVAKCAVVLLQDEDTSSSWYSGQDASVECEWIAHLR